jgi:hypothetical protein
LSLTRALLLCTEETMRRNNHHLRMLSTTTEASDACTDSHARITKRASLSQ